MEPTQCHFISTFTGLRRKGKERGFERSTLPCMEMLLGRNRMTHLKEFVMNTMSDQHQE